ncbi:MAG TPA: hypothetical protein VGJ33_13260 [Candidatus Angelobacter sp.]|jgi:hypothetical protein
MAEQEKDKQIEEMLDSMLAMYSSTEPRPGLETRILANLQSTAAREVSNGWWNFKWLWAGAVMAAVIVLGVLISGHHHAMPTDKTIVRTQEPTPLQTQAQQNSVAQAGHTISIIHRPKKDVPAKPEDKTLALNQRPQTFPSPAPLSEQEKLLLSYYAGTPREEVIAQSRPDPEPFVEPDQSQAIPDLSHVPQKFSNTK